MNHSYVFNGDADGLCALQQLRLDGAPLGALITGVKRDIALLARVSGAAQGDRCTVLAADLQIESRVRCTVQNLIRRPSHHLPWHRVDRGLTDRHPYAGLGNRPNPGAGKKT